MKIKSVFFLLLFFHYTNHVFSQADESYKVYDDSEVALIQITMTPEHLNSMYENSESDSMYISSIHFKNRYLDETVDSVGIRIRGFTTRNKQKKSLKLSFNSFVDNKFYGLEKINLNADALDPTILRSKLCWDLFKDIDVISSNASHAAVYINDNYYGLYISIEHIDENFLSQNFLFDSGNLWKCLNPASLLYIGKDPNLYKFTVEGVRPYDLKTNKSEDDYSQLAQLINVLNNTQEAQIIDSLFKIVDVVNIIKYFAFNVITGNWDDYWYGWNNYYLYFNPDIGKFNIIPYDYTNTFGIDHYYSDDWTSQDIYNWGYNNSVGDSPLARRIMTNPELRNLYSHFLEFYSNNALALNFWENRADSLKERITTYVELDTFRLKDYNYSMLDFHQSYDSIGYSADNALIRRSIKEFINIRILSIADQIEYLESKPITYKYSVNKEVLFKDDSLSIKASVFSYAGLKNVKIEIENNGTIVESAEMESLPIIESRDISKQDRWKLKILPSNTWETGKLRIVAEDNNGRISKYPSEGLEIRRVIRRDSELLINEIMASNSRSVSDQFGEFDDWIELINTSDTSVNLKGFFLSDDETNLKKWSIPVDTFIESNSYITFWCDNEPLQGTNHTNFKLSSNGEFLAIVDKDGETILDFINYPSIQRDFSYGRNLNIDTAWYYFVFPTPNSNNYIQPQPQTSEVYINEIMSNNSVTINDENNEFEDWIEIYNPQDTVVNLSGKFLTDNKNFSGKWHFPNGIYLSPDEYLIVWCDNDSGQTELHSNFNLSSNGEYFAIIDKDGVSIVDSVTFPTLDIDDSYSRNQANDNNWFVSESPTPGYSNIVTNMNHVSHYLENTISVYPNPINPTATINYEIATQMDVDLKIYDIIGRVVWSNKEEKVTAGEHVLNWNGKNNSGSKLSSGIYFLRINGKDFNSVVKLVLLR